ncbi:family 61 glycosyltransferase [Cryphonectria parasitica EP155]|uniref:EGF domain-specific O-linked N-acetylglucosamine transferase n=1 Tax=Cryphonectria parasitica (strain ATCC 38755 / EP155) TaxID=660469 RepID=A0A9P4YEW1_CRYP1|nr:family 61 glycosyltransferase [Cryphonectria parasitica EP155]KAF3771449.1 family 61 glycosyltransferase [Cryphonectria parasitica EP155]
MDKAIDLRVNKDVDLSPQGDNNKPEKFTVLIKREGELNPWHCLLEILSLSLSMDVLQMSPRDGEQGPAFFTPLDAENTQVVILDERKDGPYFDLWQLFAKKPIVRINELPADDDALAGNVIIPLPGASNPLWQGDWDPNPCAHSDLLRTFSWRVLHHYDIPDTLDGEDKVVVTFIDRREQRRLVDMDRHLAALRNRYKHAVINVVDLAALPFPEQIRLVRNSDVLAGVHGAGLTHGLWMKEHSAMVEILPEVLNHKGFRNFAGALGHDYFSTHGTKPPAVSGSWQHDDVAIEEERFLEVMDLAIKSMYNKGRNNYDVDK